MVKDDLFCDVVGVGRVCYGVAWDGSGVGKQNEAWDQCKFDGVGFGVGDWIVGVDVGAAVGEGNI